MVTMINKKYSRGWYFFPFILLFIFIFVFLKTLPQKVKYSVDEVSWIRALEVKRYQLVETSDWEDELKGEFRQTIRTNKEVRVYENVDLETKNIKEIYNNKVYYKAKMYKTIGYKIASGNDNNPFYPTIEEEFGIDGKKDVVGEKKEFLKIKIKKVNLIENGPEYEFISASENKFKEKYIKDKVVEMKLLSNESFKYDKDEWKFSEKDFEKEFEKIKMKKDD
jgi:hypothetical protein